MAIPGQETFFGELEFHIYEKTHQPRLVNLGMLPAAALAASVEIAPLDELDTGGSGNEEPKDV